MSTQTLLAEVKANNQDFEWYPTTQEIIDLINNHIKEKHCHSVLDIGAGDGRVLQQLNIKNKFAIEKSDVLVRAMDRSIICVGKDFHSTTLIDKKVDVVFCNPPYSHYEHWFEKIFKTANCTYLYLVVPSRWKECVSGLKQRQHQLTNLGSFDFLNADRKARAKVDVLCFHFYQSDPFSLWFDETFPEVKQTFEEKGDPSHTEVKTAKPTIDELESNYFEDMKKLQTAFISISALGLNVFKGLGIEKENIVIALREQIANLKNLYWRKLFSYYEPLTSRLTYKSREEFLNKLNGSVSVDFVVKNIYMITEWVIKNSNYYYDQQMVDYFLELASKDNIVKYKSNQKVFSESKLAYNKKENTHYRLDYRIVTTDRGGFSHNWGNKQLELSEFCYRGSTNAYHFLNDTLVVANNLGFDISKGKPINDPSRGWEYGKRVPFYYWNHTENKEKVLFEVKFFRNGNLHFFFAKEFMIALNVNVGRLLGWLATPEQASEELDCNAEEAKKYFQTNIQIKLEPKQFLLGVK